MSRFDLTLLEVQRADTTIEEGIMRLKYQNKPIRETVKSLGVAESTIWLILTKKYHTSELNTTKRPEDDRRIFFPSEENPLHKNQEKTRYITRINTMC